jgi:hypothetical protein
MSRASPAPLKAPATARSRFVGLSRRDHTITLWASARTHDPLTDQEAVCILLIGCKKPHWGYKIPFPTQGAQRKRWGNTFVRSMWL